jgi:hypothetical protein
LSTVYEKGADGVRMAWRNCYISILVVDLFELDVD